MLRIRTLLNSKTLILVTVLFAHSEVSAQKITTTPIDTTPYKITCTGVDCSSLTGKDGTPLPPGEGLVECPFYKSPRECCATLPNEQLLNVCKDPHGMVCQDCKMKCECFFWDGSKHYTRSISEVTFSKCPSSQAPSQQEVEQQCKESCQNAEAASYGRTTLPPWISLSGASSSGLECSQVHKKIIEDVEDLGSSAVFTK